MSKNKRNISLIVLHCSATRVNQNFTIEQLEACHKARGFQTVGYHYYITKDGTLYPGRPESQMGAHAKGFNAHSIGICYEGGLDEHGRCKDTRPTSAHRGFLYGYRRYNGNTFTLETTLFSW